MESAGIAAFLSWFFFLFSRKERRTPSPPFPTPALQKGRKHNRFLP